MATYIFKIVWDEQTASLKVEGGPFKVVEGDKIGVLNQVKKPNLRPDSIDAKFPNCIFGPDEGVPIPVSFDSEKKLRVTTPGFVYCHHKPTAQDGDDGGPKSGTIIVTDQPQS